MSEFKAIDDVIDEYTVYAIRRIIEVSTGDTLADRVKKAVRWLKGNDGRDFNDFAYQSAAWAILEDPQKTLRRIAMNAQSPAMYEAIDEALEDMAADGTLSEKTVDMFIAIIAAVEGK